MRQPLDRTAARRPGRDLCLPTERADRGASVATLDGACSAIAYQHRRHGLADPILHDGVRQVRRGLRRTLGTAPRRQARPLGLAEIRQILAGIDRATAKGARDAALILLGYASALRRSELVALTLADIEPQPKRTGFAGNDAVLLLRPADANSSDRPHDVGPAYVGDLGVHVALHGAFKPNSAHFRVSRMWRWLRPRDTSGHDGPRDEEGESP